MERAENDFCKSTMKAIRSIVNTRLKQSVNNVRLRVVPFTKRFRKIYQENGWGGIESHSGPGSSLLQTREIRSQMPILINELGARLFLDIPCGDFTWMKEVNLGIKHYIGADILEDLIQKNDERFGSSSRKFVMLDIRKGELPRADIIFCRDCLVHFSFKDIWMTLKNIKSSDSTYLVMTTFTERLENKNIISGQWRPLDFSKAPFVFPKPDILISEQCTEPYGDYGDKCIGVWKVVDIPNR